ncbi:S-adenosyl-L-methionine-dependent methyltransferase [Peziza echinospora]|nr:S-adenosyl-L-methionine-dependent methyltransferase [Peziza echinospora]
MNGSTNHYEHGRRYHGFRSGSYMYPNDEAEKDRLDMIHKMYLVLRKDELHRAPITRNYAQTRILDLGTGTGIWAMDMADKYPDAEVIGVDLSLIQPKWIPENVRFVISDFESEWALGKESFDLVHLRSAIGSVSSWKNLFRKAFEHLKPGYGWIEYVDIDMETYSEDGSLSPKSHLSQWQQILFDATDRTGKPLRYSTRVREQLMEAGFVDIQQTTIRVPLNAWPTDPYMKECGRWFGLSLMEGLEAISLGPLTRVLGWAPDDVKQFIAPVKKDISNKSIHGFNNLHIWIARRP